jgi:hypothetical protein
VKFLKILATKLGAMRKSGKVAFSDPPPDSTTTDLVEDGFELTTADQPTRDELIAIGLIEDDDPPSDCLVVEAPPLEGSLADRRRRVGL